MDKKKLYKGLEIPDTVVMDGVELVVDKEEVYQRHLREQHAAHVAAYHGQLHEGQVVLIMGKVLDCHDSQNVVVEVIEGGAHVRMSVEALAKAEHAAKSLLDAVEPIKDALAE